MQTDIIKFSDCAEEELTNLMQEMQVGRLLPLLKTESNITPDERQALRNSLAVLGDLFGTELPEVSGDIFEDMRAVSRDINLARILKERGLFRFYRLLKLKQTITDGSGKPVEVPLFTGLIDPDTGEQFVRQEDFVGWFCRNAKIARSLVFQRMATIDRLVTLGEDLEGAYQVLISKPYAIPETLKTLGTWGKAGELVNVDPAIAERLAYRALPESVDRVKELREIIEDPESTHDEVAEASHDLAAVVKPAILAAVKEVASHESVKDALDFVHYDLAAKPEIGYRWDYEHGCLEIEYVEKARDVRGTEYVASVSKIKLVPDVDALPGPVQADLIKRLPIKNRDVPGK